MNDSTIAVVGGTGALGQPVVRRLLEEGYAARLLIRNEEKARQMWGTRVSHVVGDVESDEAVRRAVAGASGVHISLSGGANPESRERIEHRGTARIAQCAREEGWAGSPISPACTSATPQPCRGPTEGSMALKRRFARAVCPTRFSGRHTSWTPSHDRSGEAAQWSSGPSRIRCTWVAATDFAAMVARSFAGGHEVDGSFHVHGPEGLTMHTALSTYCELLSPGTQVATMPLFMMRAINRLFMGGKLSRELEIVRLLNEIGEVGDSQPTSIVFGEPKTTLRAWCLARRDEQRGITERHARLGRSERR
ncbi:MAG: NAD(P)H-binding protein [Gemmatimonadetes bacterium]|nr:NAD(P)H-binding protein [Gemmatimonadota bacterium]